MYEMATKNKNDDLFIEEDETDASSGSDFDDDEDPDKIEVPGGGKDLATVAEFGSKNSLQKMQKPTSDDVIFVKATPPTVSSSSLSAPSTLPLPPLKSLPLPPTSTNTTSANKIYPTFRSAGGTTKDGGVNNVSSTSSSMNVKHLPIVGNASSGGSSIMIGNNTGNNSDHINSGSGLVGKKLPAGLVTKANTTGYDIIKPNLANISNMPNMPNMSNMSNMSNMTNFSNMSNLSSLSNMSNMANMSQGLPHGMGTSAMMGMGMGLGGPMSGYYPTNNLYATLLAQMEMAGMGFGGGRNDHNSVQYLNQFMLQNLQQILASNPNYLTAGIPNNLLNQMWMEPSKVQTHFNEFNQMPQEDEEGEDEEMGVAETYADYWPAKLKLGKKHPDPVVETASLSSVEPADITYKLSISTEIINSGVLSALQLESITYASQAHEKLLPDGSRAGFLIGDGAGVGKGRTIAGIIYENYLKGRKKSLWISVSNDLKYDAERDIRDIGATRISVHQLNKLKYEKISSSINNNVKKGIIFSTYSALIGESSNSAGKYKTRLKQLLQWCGDDFDGCIVFDECHKAKNLCPVGSSKPTKTGLTVLDLQNKLPKARVVYASATGASEPRNMAYMIRLGMWGQGTPFTKFPDFISAVEKRGVGAMEIVAMDMKLRGMYIARQLSFHGVTFKIDEVPLSDEFENMYDTSVRLWVEAMQKFTEAAELIDAENRMKKTMWGQFWSAHQRFFKYLCIAAKVNHAVSVAREAIKYGKCVVIGLQSTGEARTLEQLEREDGELSDFVSTAKGVFQSLVEKHFPAPDRNHIQRVLGIEPPKKTIFELLADAVDKKIKKPATTNNSNTATMAAKRKSSRQAAQRSKRRRGSSDGSDDYNMMSPIDSDISDYKVTDSESESSFRGSGDESNQSSDFNPFHSDSDDDPWVAGRKQKQKKKKKKKVIPKKKATSTQDKIQEFLTKKHTDAKLANSAAATTTTTTTPLTADSLIKATNGIGGKTVLAQQLHQAKSMLGGPPPKDAIERACAMKEELLKKIDKLGDKLPPNTLDQLIDELGGTDNVAEMTGRKGRVIQTNKGAIQYESRSEQDVPLETLNLTEKQRFMNGEKDVAIISEAASSGISLQSDRRVRNQRRRVHITLELPWSADRAIQQFGRTHRSNQVNAPEYIFLISNLAGERRFASTVAKRLESLGALTHGDRRATETRDLSQFNIDNKYGRSALEAVMKTIMGYEQPMVQPPQDYKGDFFKDIAGALVGVGIIVNSEAAPGVLSLDKDYNNISKFLNRILGMPVELQNRLFKYFTDTLAAIITQAKKMGRFDLGILDLGAAGENVTRIKLTRFIRKHATGIAPAELHTVQVERGMIWQEAIDKWADLIAEKEGFYLSHITRNSKQTAILAVAIDSNITGGANSSTTTNTKKKSDSKLSKKDMMFQIYRPNTGLQIRRESLADIEKKYKKVQSDDAEIHWTQQYDASVNTCSHAYWRGNCRTVSMGHECEIGLRRRTYTVLSGSVLAVWGRVEHTLSSVISSSSNKMQVIRLKTTEGNKIVGTLIPKSCVDLLVEDLRSDAENVEEQTFEKK